MEIAKFILTVVGTFLSVFTLSFAIFQYWKKKQDEKINILRESIKNRIDSEKLERKESIDRVHKRVDQLESRVIHDIQRRMSNIEGELKGLKPILLAIQNWFINNTSPGGKNG